MNSALVFPVSLMERANDFDSLINDVSAATQMSRLETTG